MGTRGDTLVWHSAKPYLFDKGEDVTHRALEALLVHRVFANGEMANDCTEEG